MGESGTAPPRQFPIAVNTYPWIWRHGVHETLVRLGDAGWGAVEVLVNPPHCWPEALPPAARCEVARLCRAGGPAILSLNPPMLDLNLLSSAPEMRRYSIEHYRRVIELAGEWGAPYVVVVAGKLHPLRPAPRSIVWSWLAVALEELSLLADREGVVLALENVPNGFLSSAALMEEAVARLALPKLSVCWDVANATFSRDDPAAGIARLAGHLALIHLSDTGLDVWGHAAPGDGVVRFDAVAGAMRGLARVPLSVLEVIAPDGETATAAGLDALARLGWRRASAADVRPGV